MWLFTVVWLHPLWLLVEVVVVVHEEQAGVVVRVVLVLDVIGGEEVPDSDSLLFSSTWPGGVLLPSPCTWLPCWQFLTQLASSRFPDSRPTCFSSTFSLISWPGWRSDIAANEWSDCSSFRIWREFSLASLLLETPSRSECLLVIKEPRQFSDDRCKRGCWCCWLLWSSTAELAESVDRTESEDDLLLSDPEINNSYWKWSVRWIKAKKKRCIFIKSIWLCDNHRSIRLPYRSSKKKYIYNFNNSLLLKAETCSKRSLYLVFGLGFDVSSWSFLIACREKSPRRRYQQSKKLLRVWQEVEWDSAQSF